MDRILIQGLVVILIWVGAWGLFEIIVDDIAGDDRRIRLATYFTFVIIGIFILWLISVTLT